MRRVKSRSSARSEPVCASRVLLRAVQSRNLLQRPVSDEIGFVMRAGVTLHPAGHVGFRRQGGANFWCLAQANL
eukprot:964639-Pleurochrysis_carterae.AAC.1